MVENTLQGKVLKNVKLYRVSPDAVVKVPAGGIPVFKRQMPPASYQVLLESSLN